MERLPVEIPADYRKAAEEAHLVLSKPRLKAKMPCSKNTWIAVS